MSDGMISPHHAEELAACFAAHARELFGYASWLTRGDRAQAEDLVQIAAREHQCRYRGCTRTRWLEFRKGFDLTGKIGRSAQQKPAGVIGRHRDLHLCAGRAA